MDEIPYSGVIMISRVPYPASVMTSVTGKSLQKCWQS